MHLHILSMPVFFKLFNLVVIFMTLVSCSVNKATGERQFTAFVPESSEAKIGAENHQAVLAEFGYYDDAAIQSYVNGIGQKLAANTERDGVKYTFTVIDSPVVNAFAVPGGYIYISRGLMALANDEAELASVIGHEIGHITARHSAQQQSQGILANLGLTALSIAVDTPGLSRAAGLGTDLYLKSYSRKHEHQADELGIRYSYRGGYNPYASADFLRNLQADSALQDKIEGKQSQNFYYFSTHPLTADRIAETITLAGLYPKPDTDDRKVEYFSRIEGLIYGDSPRHGMVKGQDFVHTELGFKMSFPEGFKISNHADKVVGESSSQGALIIFDGDKKAAGQSIQEYLISDWKRGQSGYATPEILTINGMPAVTTSYTSVISGYTKLIRNIAIAFSDTQVFRMTMVTSVNPPPALLTQLKTTTYSFKRLSNDEKKKYPPKRIKIFAAKAGDSVASVAARMPFENNLEDRFRVLNGMKKGDNLIPNKLYKTVVQ